MLLIAAIRLLLLTMMARLGLLIAAVDTTFRLLLQALLTLQLLLLLLQPRPFNCYMQIRLGEDSTCKWQTLKWMQCLFTFQWYLQNFDNFQNFEQSEFLQEKSSHLSLHYFSYTIASVPN